MNKLHLLHKAEKLYCVENITPEMIAEKLNIMDKISNDIDNNQQTPQSELYSLMNILKNLPQLKSNINPPKVKSEKHNQIPVDIVKIVERDILGME